MGRIARVVVPGIPHHIVQRGNNRAAVFLDDDDRRVYLHRLWEQSERFGLSVIGYCLMTNHVHIVGVPREADSLAKAIGRTHYGYTQWANDRHERSGHLWQSRFYSCPLGEAHACTALLYVERNPVRAGLAGRPWEYEWSSARAHVGIGAPPHALDMVWWQQHWDEPTWRELLATARDDQELRDVRSHTATGRPLGSPDFIMALEALAGRHLRPRRPGRPRKNSDSHLFPGADSPVFKADGVHGNR